jgi:hypothetical protein
VFVETGLEDEFCSGKVPRSIITIEHLQADRATLTASSSFIVVKFIKRTFVIYTFDAHLLEDMSSQSRTHSSHNLLHQSYAYKALLFEYITIRD